MLVWVSTVNLVAAAVLAAMVVAGTPFLLAWLVRRP